MVTFQIKFSDSSKEKDLEIKSACLSSAKWKLLFIPSTISHSFNPSLSSAAPAVAVARPFINT